MTLSNIRTLYPEVPRWVRGSETDADRIKRYGWDPFVTCSFCGDHGTLPGTGLPCHCLIGTAKETQRLRAERWPTLVPRRFRHYTLSGHPNQQLAGEVCQWLDRQPTGENLVIQGSVGTGKTGAAIGAVRELHFSGATVRYWSLPDLLDQLRAEEFERKQDGPVDMGRKRPTMSWLIECDYLLLDDMGTERTHSEYVTDRLYLIFNGRYTENRPTIITTNVPPSKWGEYLGDRAASRINEQATYIRAGGTDLRKRAR